MSLVPAIVVIFQEASFACPLLVSIALLSRYRQQSRMLVAALFSFLYLGGVLLALQVLNRYIGWWTFGHSSLALLGLPAQIWMGWALTLGPVLFLGFPKTSPLLLFAPLVLLDYLLMPMLDPFVSIGNGWLYGKILVLVLAYLPAQYLARWTAGERCLPQRAALLAVAHGCAALLVIPSAIMLAMGGRWMFPFLSWHPLLLLLLAVGFAICMVIGLSAVQLFVVHGEGTPIPLDHTRHLVRCGLYAYLSNPMQLCTALAWALMGLALLDVWIALAAVMAWVFVRGLVRWHHRQDLAVRFPAAWREYMGNVPAWWPRWKPWVYQAATLWFDPDDARQAILVRWLRQRHSGLHLVERRGAGLLYVEPDRTLPFHGLAAAAKALDHVNLLWALLAAAILLPVLPLQALRGKASRAEVAEAAHEH